MNVEEARIHPCENCGMLRTKSEGGTIFTVCDKCWDKDTINKIAENLWKAHKQLNIAQKAVAEVLDKIFGEEGWEDFSSDDYDESLEIFGLKAGLVLSEEQQRIFWDAGFTKLWTHEHKEWKHQPGQRYYAKK